MDEDFPPIRFNGTLRPTQQRAADIVAQQIRSGEHRLHVVAPPGSGKTVLGLYIWAEMIRKPAVVLSPNAAIQIQWTKRLDLFDQDHGDAIASTDPASPAWLTSLTYQSLTLPKRGGDDLDAAAMARWCEKLIQEGEAENQVQAQAWIEGLAQHNREHHDMLLARHRKHARDQIAQSDAMAVLHDSARASLERLRDRGVGLIILDECHHLMSHWGRVLHDAHDMLGAPAVLGLTATPPHRRGRDAKDLARYDRFFGPIDFEVPTPALVRDGHLAPYQDLAYIVRPTSGEMQYLAQTDKRFRRLVQQLSEPSAPDPNAPRTAPLPVWVAETLAARRLPSGAAETWADFARRDPAMAEAGPRYLLNQNIPWPEGVPRPSAAPSSDPMATLAPLLDRYVRHGLLRSPSSLDHNLARRLMRALALLGLQITETGTRPCASPVSRVLAYSQAKTHALQDILANEQKALGDRIRAVVVTDFEKTSAMATVQNVLDSQAGGAVAAFTALVTDPRTDPLDPVLLTGSTLLVDDDLVERFLTESRAHLKQQGLKVALVDEPAGPYHQIFGRGGTWGPRQYVGMITEMFQRGVCRCLVGTRGLLGEGWDAHTVNVLVDLTTATSSMTVNQLRGRSIRIDPDQPKKVANNWDVVCVAGEFARGLADYERFIDKHKTLYGVCDDGAIEKGAGHVHPAFTELEPEGVGGVVGAMNDQMLQRAAQRDQALNAWQIGQPFEGEARRAVEISGGGGGGFPPFKQRAEAWTDHALALAVGRAVLEALVETDQVTAPHPMRGEPRAGGYSRLFLNDASTEEATLFADAVAEVMGPLQQPRYVIPRYVDEIHETWLSKLLPEVLARYVRSRSRHRVMLHAVPTALAGHRDKAAAFARAWNRHVSPGEAVYALRGSGQQLLDEALQQGLGPKALLHAKDVFV